jgi:hypothetical protein
MLDSTVWEEVVELEPGERKVFFSLRSVRRCFLVASRLWG